MAALPALRDLQALLDARFPDATPVPRRTDDGVPSGIEALDAILPNGGFPRGRLSVWAPHGGATAIGRATVQAAAERGERVAWIDGAGTVAGVAWDDGPLLVRPPGRVPALRAAEVLLRSGGFAVVVVSGAEPSGTENVRLARAAHEGHAVCLALAANAAMAGLKASSRIAPTSYAWERGPFGEPARATGVRIDVTVAAFGWQRRATVELAIRNHDNPSALAPSLPDRRGLPTDIARPPHRIGRMLHEIRARHGTPSGTPSGTPRREHVMAGTS